MPPLNIKTILLSIFVVVAVILVIKNFERIKKFILEAIVELKKVSWLTKRELRDSAWIVLVSSIVLGVFIGMTDFVLSKIIGVVIK